MLRNRVLALAIIASLPAVSLAQEGGMQGSGVGPTVGDREFSISGSGNSEQDFDSGSLSVTGDLGWYVTERWVLGIRQSVNYASIQGTSIEDDFWNGSTRGFADYHFGRSAWRPFLGANLGLVYGDGVEDTGLAGLEAGLKYYVLPKTFISGLAEYQWFFESSDEADDQFDDGAWVYSVGLGFNF
ncbi:hypothetical protein CKO13_10010 [Halorhodospira neutriphila]|uniref:Outer membrane protein beta-barrel domain-containing protein n=1 Tax=Halorhodospira neutriphila TaxID=168379 RepID=A0ABS1EBR3_9GAMM|nr:outer membrane beta-barrel protein [Halorhodospira neutriphila]MBK1727344.1 hypothetical protein [Halorhodospira neutriphila]